MARPASISREQILEAARAVFLNEGVSASTARIAKAAGVSEGSIFKRFATKEELFREALGISNLRIGPEIGELLAEGTLEEGLEKVGLRLVRMFRELLPRMMMLWANHSGDPRDFFERLRCTEGDQPLPLLVLRALSAQLEQQQRQGRLRDIDPEIMARTMVGSIHNFVFHELVGLNERQPLAAASFVRGVVDLLLRGASPTGEIHE